MSIQLLHKAAKLAGADKHSNKRWLLGCVIVRSDGAIVGSVNHDAPDRHFEAHAEARALRKADYGGTLYVARVLREDLGKWALAKPCFNCQRLIRQRRIRKVFYTIGPNEYGVWYPGEGEM